ncbi:metal-sensitive transcriptional regulator [Modestobacter excelsi]|uniref:metal-sensitive transcriptional regulator n=1 Tax=Modestobacter excelsi TaxID=2213161 RepID=UPI00110CDC41|nr:metal-sensitive transcriptional regulator [Modestobacter excelsi]
MPRPGTSTAAGSPPRWSARSRGSPAPAAGDRYPGGYDGCTTGHADDKEQVLARLERVEGQVRCIARMVEEDTCCIDVLTPVSAATKALQAVTSSADDDGAAAEAKIAEASTANLVLAGLAMAASSVLVVANSLRLRGFRSAVDTG